MRGCQSTAYVDEPVATGPYVKECIAPKITCIALPRPRTSVLQYDLYKLQAQAQAQPALERLASALVVALPASSFRPSGTFG